jgi:hypothetical protein
MSKFKVGDKVCIKPSKLSDLDSDMRQDLSDRSLSGAAYDAFIKAIEEGEPFIVTEVVLADGVYELKLGKRKFGYQMEEDDLLEFK